MTRGVNKAILIGNLGQDPEVRYTPSGSAVCNLSLATTEFWKSRETGERQEKTEWHRLVFFGKLAEIVGEYLRKGSQIYTEGRLQTRKWQDQGGNDRYTTEIVVSDMQILGSRSNNTAKYDRGPRQEGAQPGNAQPGNAQPGNAQPGNAQPAGVSPQYQKPEVGQASGNEIEGENFDDDIPF